jgi:hypothetical protein
MRVFWSWQSDLPGKVSRYLIKEALELAIDALNQERDIVEAERPLELDQDRKGVPGSPDLANVIFEKIRAADVFVADVTPVGQSASSPAKKLMNPNVAIELGYGLGTIGDRKLVMVLNEHYGSRDDLPFDLRHKAGPILYRLPPDATKNEIEAATKSLSSKLKSALRMMIASPPAVAEQFMPTPPQSTDPSRFFSQNEALFEAENFSGEATSYFATKAPTLYLRVRPTRKSPQVARADLLEKVRSRHDWLPPLYYNNGGNSINGNKFGVISSAVASSEILCGVQVMLNHEIWAFNSTLLKPLSDGRNLVKTMAVEMSFAFCLPRYLQFMEEVLAVAPPFEVEAGAYGVQGYKLGMPNDYGMFDQWKPVQLDHVVWSGKLSDREPGSVDKALLQIFEQFFDACFQKRPLALYKFPGAIPGSMPS